MARTPVPRSFASGEARLHAKRALGRTGKATLQPGHPIGRRSAANSGRPDAEASDARGTRRKGIPGETGKSPLSAPPGARRNPGSGHGSDLGERSFTATRAPARRRLPEFSGAPLGERGAPTQLMFRATGLSVGLSRSQSASASRLRSIGSAPASASRCRMSRYSSGRRGNASSLSPALKACAA